MIAHNVKGLRCDKVVEKFPIMLASLQRMVTDFLNVVQAAHRSYLPDGALDALVQPTQRGERHLAGVDLHTLRMRAICEAVLALAPKSGGFTTAELRNRFESFSLPASVPTFPARPATIYPNFEAKRWSNESTPPGAIGSLLRVFVSWLGC